MKSVRREARSGVRPERAGAPRRAWGAAAAVALAAALACAGCSPPGAGKTATAGTQSFVTEPVTTGQVAALGDVTLRMWADQAEKPLMKSVVPAFEEKYSNVTVDITYKSFDDLVATVVNAASGSTPPDLFQGNIGYAVDGALVKAKLVRPLDDVAATYGWLTGTGASTLAPARWNSAGTAFGDGNLYGMSPISEVQGIYYNKALLKSLGLAPPQSLSDLEKQLPVVEKAGKQPVMLGNSDQYAATHIFSDLAATEQDPTAIRDWIGGKANTTFATTGNEKAADTMADWAKKGYFGSGYDGLSNEDAIARFAKGSGAYFVGGSWNGAKLAPEKFGFGALTTGGAGATASPWHIAAASKATPAAVAFLAALHTPEAGQEILDTGRLPVVTDGVRAANSLQSQTLDALKRTIAAGTQIGYYDWSATDMLTVMGGGLQEVMAGRTSSADFTKTVQDTWRKARESK
ncbi:raffinose/stachyose/melibiose transport system substrate-binding protein [Streptomyces aurantiacus]|uniref:ABC transporter substrate-binding protein n=1 Tax=Streptomyces aurantiacus TaxID=47760 RepID=UPI0027909C35|nr:extracellular solute-binding protein [Streptomyces aurantiacus]MDQ0779656.1 raffinose/stachyose/melibiose transport system substrate-binding protein [Streptomyces aurantiacus]